MMASPLGLSTGERLASSSSGTPTNGALRAVAPAMGLAVVPIALSGSSCCCCRTCPINGLWSDGTKGIRVCFLTIAEYATSQMYDTLQTSSISLLLFFPPHLACSLQVGGEGGTHVISAISAKIPPLFWQTFLR